MMKRQERKMGGNGIGKRKTEIRIGGRRLLVKGSREAKEENGKSECKVISEAQYIWTVSFSGIFCSISQLSRTQP